MVSHADDRRTHVAIAIPVATPFVSAIVIAPALVRSFARLTSTSISTTPGSPSVGGVTSRGVTETVDTPPGESAARSGFWGALLGTLVAGPVGTIVGGAVSAGLGALTAKLVDIGIPDATVKEIEGAVAPSSSSLAILVSHVKEDALARELERFQGAKLVRSDLTAGTVERLEGALAGRAAT